MEHTEHVLSLVRTERKRQTGLFIAGLIDVPCDDPNEANGLKLAVLGEEFGEVARALLEGKGLATELVQVAAVAVAWAESLVEGE